MSFGDWFVVVGSAVMLKVKTALLTSYSKGERGTRRGMARRRGGPGIVFLVTSSVNCNSLDYGKSGAVRAPGIRHLTTRNIHFASTRTITTADAPSHCSLFAKRCT